VQLPELTSHHSLLKFLSYLGMESLPHAPVNRSLKDRAFVLNCGTLKGMVARIGHRLRHRFLRLHNLVPFVCLCDYMIRLMAEPRRQFAVPLQYLIGRMKLLAVAGAMRGNLRRARTLSADLLQVFFDLDTTRARCLQILLRVALDLRLAMLAAFNLIAYALKSHCKLGAVHAGRILLRLKQAALLQCACLPIVTLGHVENDRVRVKLGRGIAIYGASGVMLEGRGDKLACCLWRMDVPDPRLCIPFQFMQCHANTFAVRLAHAIIPTHKSRK
jgi:hypothetical protein